MNTIKPIPLALALGLATILASGSALAYGGHGYHGHHGGTRVGVFIGAPAVGFGFGSPYYGYPGYAYGYRGYGYGYPGYAYGDGPYAYYAPTTTIVQVAPPVYVEQGSASGAASVSDGNWYYCHNPDGYYPYVKQCNEGWQRVPAQPSR